MNVITSEKAGKYSYDRAKVNLVGQKFNKLNVIKWLGFAKIGSQQKRRSVYECLCECGNTCEAMQTDLKSGNKKSCGCLLSEVKNYSYKGEGYAIITTIVNNYKQSAKKKNREFSLTREKIEELIRSECFYCGEMCSNDRKSYNTIDKNGICYNGIDRLDNSKGYTSENCVACCKTCNFLKKDYSKDEFLKIIKKIYEYKVGKHNKKFSSGEGIDS